MTDKCASAIAHPITYWLHVNDDGSEQQFNRPPNDVLSLTVTRSGKFETTSTWDRFGNGGMATVRPRGEGWTLVARKNGFSTWKRAVPDFHD
jgi:hypothetical protein